MKSRYGLEIRAALSADAPGLVELLSVTGQKFSTHTLLGRLEAMQQEPGAALIASGWGPPIGLVLLHWYQTLDADQPTAQITTLLVAPEERRKGIGRLLVKAAAQTARIAGCSTLAVLAAPEEQDLHAFCQVSGFIKVGTRFFRPLRKKGQQFEI